MHQTKTVRLLGSVLQQAGLVSAAQVNLVLKTQHETRQRLGELLANYGWINQETADFFAEEWPECLQESSLRPLGHYFRDAHLLSESQIDYVLEQQKLTQLRFGALVVANGWLKLETVRFFLESLYQQDAYTPSQAEPETPLTFNEPDDWEQLRESVLENEEVNPYLLLQRYEQILLRDTVVFSGENEQIALIDSGLVQKDNDCLVAHPLIRQVFNQEWVRRELLAIHPYDKMRLQCLNLSEAGQYPYRILSKILAWTNGQTLLTQKIADLVRSEPYILTGSESMVVDQLVQTKILDQRCEEVIDQHFQFMENVLLTNHICKPIDLLTYYQFIWCQHQSTRSYSPEEIELIRLGFLIQDDQEVKVANLIYRSVFDQDWIEKKLLSQLSILSSPSDSSEIMSSPGETIPVDAPTLNHWSTYLQRLSPKLNIPKSVFKKGLFALGLIGVGATLWWLFSSSPAFQNEGTAPAKEETLSDKKQPVQLPQSLISETPSETPEPQSNSEKKPFEQKPELGLGPSNAIEDSEIPKRVNLSSNIATYLEKVVQLSSDSQIPLFLTGTQEQKIILALGQPTLKSAGYWPNSYGLLYKNIAPHQTDLGYLFDIDTQRLRQTEVAFSQAAGLDTISKTLEGLLKGNQSEDIKETLSLIFQRQIQDYEFQVGNLKGVIQRNEEDRIYIGIWEADFH